MSGSSKTEKTSTQQTSPWAPQAGALTNAFNEAQNVYNSSKSVAAPTDFVAQFTPEQLANFRDAINYSTTSGVSSRNDATGGALSGAGTNATIGALSGFGSYDPTKLNNTGSIIDTANQYVKGQNIDAAVNDAMLNARQNVRDVVLPGIEQNAAITGNTNSSRTGIAQGLVERGLAEQATNLGANLRSNAFKDGLALASDNAKSNNTLNLGALSQGADAGIGAAGLGVNASSGSIADKLKLLGIGADGGSGLQGANQANLDNLMARYKQAASGNFDALNSLMGIIGSANWGSNSSGTETSTKTPSMWEIAGGLLGASGNTASTAGGLGWRPFK